MREELTATSKQLYFGQWYRNGGKGSQQGGTKADKWNDASEAQHTVY